MIDFKDLKGKFVKVSFDVEAYDKSSGKDTINLVAKGSLEDYDGEFVKIKDVKDGIMVIRIENIVTMHQIGHDKIMRFIEKESEKSALQVTIKNLDKKLEKFQERIKPDLEMLDKKVEKIHKDIVK